MYGLFHYNKKTLLSVSDGLFQWVEWICWSLSTEKTAFRKCESAPGINRKESNQRADSLADADLL